MSEELQRLDKPVRVDWAGAEAVPIQTANQFLVQVDVAGDQPDQLVLAVGQLTPPLVLGTPEEKAAQLADVERVLVNTVARFSITPARLRELVRLLENAAKIWDAPDVSKSEVIGA